MTNTKLRLRLSNPLYFLATGFGSGLLPIIPGTMGTIVAIPFWILMNYLLPVWFCWGIILFGFIFGVIICQRISDDILVHDHSSIVLDEFIGMWITLMAIPIVNWKWVLIAFILFRFFDILKCWPISLVDKKVGGGFGIMLDDIIAAIFSIFIITILMYSSTVF